MDVENANVWKDIEIRVDPDPLCTSCHISKINRNPVSKTPLNHKTHFKWEFMDIIPVISYNFLTKYSTIDNFLLIIDANSNIPKLYGMENITAEEVVDDLDMFQTRLGKIDEFEGWDMERIQTDDSTEFSSKEFQEGIYVCDI